MEEFRKVGLTTCTALVLANMIGTGVFTSLGFQVAAISSPFLILVVWTLGGLVALCGALSYAELAAALPRSGGEYHFLTKSYHPAVGFMGGFVSIAVGFAAPIALAAMAFGRYLAAAVPGTPPVAVSVVIVLALATVHALTVRASGRFQVFITSMKVTLITAFIVIGFVKGFQVPAEFAPRAGFLREVISAPFAVALMFVLYSYSGWNAAAYIINEVRNPQRTVPRALILATLAVTILYVALNAVFLGSGPMQGFSDQIEVGEIAARNLLGVRGGQIMSGLIAAGLVSAVSAMTWAGPRVAQTVGQDFPALGFLSRTSPGGVPRTALLLQTSLVLVMLLTSTFESVLVYAQFAILTCSFLTVLGVIVLRVRQPDLPRPFRCPCYPATPLVFLSLNLFALVYTAIAEPGKAAAGLGTLGVGLGLYFLIRQGRIFP
jgi:APA family basic amino acid/polyamine antiporter